MQLSKSNMRRLLKHAEKVTNEEIKAAVQSANDEALSIRSLMSKQESAVLINHPREYQIELFERAKQENIIAVLDTGHIPELEHAFVSLLIYL